MIRAVESTWSVVLDEPADRKVETGPAAVVDRELLTPADR